MRASPCLQTRGAEGLRRASWVNIRGAWREGGVPVELHHIPSRGECSGLRAHFTEGGCFRGEEKSVVRRQGNEVPEGRQRKRSVRSDRILLERGVHLPGIKQFSPNPLAATAISDPLSGLRAVAQGRSRCHIQRLGDTHQGTGHCPLSAGGGYEAGVKGQGCGIVCVLGRERARVMKVTVSLIDGHAPLGGKKRLSEEAFKTWLGSDLNTTLHLHGTNVPKFNNSSPFYSFIGQMFTECSFLQLACIILSASFVPGIVLVTRYSVLVKQIWFLP